MSTPDALATANPDNRLPRLLLLAEAARELGVPSRTLRRWARLGRVPAVRIGGHCWWIDVGRMRELLGSATDPQIRSGSSPHLGDP